MTRPIAKISNPFTFNVHLVEHQVFYTPLYMCEEKFSMKYTKDEYLFSDKNLVNELFHTSESEPEEIDIFITGGPDVVTHLIEKDPARGKVVFWMPVVDRFPLPLITANSKDEIHTTLSTHQIKLKKAKFSNIYSPPEDTTLHYFLSKYYDRDAFVKKYLGPSFSDEERKKIIDHLEKYNSIFNGQLKPQPNFDSIAEKVKADPESLGFWFANDESIRKVKKFDPPMEAVAFTCIFTKSDIWENERKRNSLIEFCKQVSLNINDIYEFNKHFHRDSQSFIYKHFDLKPAYSKIVGEGNNSTIEKKKQKFISNLKFLARNRVFATDLKTDLQLKGERIRCIENKIEEDTFYKFRLYYWMSEGYVINTAKAMEELHKENAFKAGVSKATYNLGHFLKNRLTSITKNLYNCFGMSNSLDGQIKAFQDLVTSAMNDVRRGENIGKMLNIISLLEYNDEKSVFSRLPQLKERTNSEYINSRNPYFIKRGITAIKDYLESKGWFLELDGLESTENLHINNIVPGEEGIFRPKSFFYDEVILELMLNAANHSDYDQATPRNRKLIVGYDESMNGVVISNDLNAEKYAYVKSKLRQPDDRWTNVFQSTGLYNYDSILGLTKTGNIYIKTSTKKEEKKGENPQESYSFHALLTLEGLNNTSHE